MTTSSIVPDNQAQKENTTLKNNEKPFGYYQFEGYKKAFYKWAQKLPKNVIAFKIGLVLRKLTLQNKTSTVDANQFGLNLRLYPIDNLGDRFLLFMPKYFEYDEFQLMSTYLKPDSTFIDIGGNMGIYSLTAAKYIKDKGRILAFEPNPVMIARFGFNIAANGFEKLIDLNTIGIADKNSSFNLALPDSNLGGASIVGKAETNITIQCRPLVDVLKEKQIEHIDLLKIDIENAEPLALNPFFRDAPRSLYPKSSFIESDENIDLEGYGYRFKTRTRAHNSIYILKD